MTPPRPEAAADILVVDDEPDLRALLEDYLGMQGYAVRSAPDAAGLDRRLAERAPDLIVLDVNMPGESGLDALARLRAAGCQAGVILLTAAAGLDARLDGLARGADDHIAKPFEPRELLARVRAVLRRLPPRPAARPPLRMGRCTFDAAGRRLIDPTGAEIALTAMEYDLLDVFARHPGRPLARDRLAELAHGRPLGPGDRSIDIRVLRLRQKIEADPSAPRALRTVHGQGYLFDPEG